MFMLLGLPHCHMLIHFEADDKIITADDVDSLIEIPDPDVDLDLYNVIVQSHFHGPCGVLNPNSRCMEDGECSKKYPKEFSARKWIPSLSQTQQLKESSCWPA